MTVKIPSSWTKVLLSDIADVNPRNPEVIPDDGDEISFVPMAAVKAIVGIMDPSGRRKWGAVKKGYKRFQEGDVLFAKITPCMENGKVVLAKGLHNGVGAGSTEFHVLRVNEAVETCPLQNDRNRRPIESPCKCT